MKLFVSVLFLAAATAGLAQNQTPAVVVDSLGQVTVIVPPGNASSPEEIETLKATARAQVFAGSTQSQQLGCPLMLTGAHLNWPATYLPVTSAERVTEPSLALNFRNEAGKAIRSVGITARFLAKRNPYQLDATPFDLRLTFGGVGAADQAASQLREIRLPEKMYAFGVTRVSLDQVTFADGSFWMASGRSNCSLDVKSSAERVEAR